MSNSFPDGMENRPLKYSVSFTAQFKRDYKLMKKRGMNLAILAEVIAALADGEALPEKNRDHELSGDWKGHRECHLQPDWLLIYRIENEVLVLTLTRTGTHSDLFAK